MFKLIETNNVILITFKICNNSTLLILGFLQFMNIYTRLPLTNILPCLISYYYLP